MYSLGGKKLPICKIVHFESAPGFFKIALIIPSLISKVPYLDTEQNLAKTLANAKFTRHNLFSIWLKCLLQKIMSHG